jgi:hypothetical protein
MLRAAILAGGVLLAGPAGAQDTDYRLDAAVTFYGDNTEFFNPFRKGETLLGTHVFIVGEARTSDRLAIRGGIFGNERFGSDEAFEDVRPVLTLEIGPPASRLVLGTIETVRRAGGMGPDLTSPHGLLPPLQVETLAFTRPWEAGLQWLVETANIRQDAWVHWQRLGDGDRRERFDAGVTSRVRVHRAITLGGDLFVVHEGGQLTSNGHVGDSLAGAVGGEVGGPAGPVRRLSLEAFLLASRFAPERLRPERTRAGFATFLRAAAAAGWWRAHAIMFRGDDFITAEGDPNYQSVRLDGTGFRALRDYAEAGVTTLFPLAKESWIEASFRGHRVERDLEYSFRILAVAKLRID